MRKRSIVLALIAASVVMIARAWSPGGSDILLDKLWIDRLPIKPRSFAQLLFFSSRGWGLMLRASAYRDYGDAIEFDHRDGFKVRILQDDVVEEWKVRAWKCQPGEAPDPDFDDCMTVERNGVVTKYFSWEEDEEAAMDRLAKFTSWGRSSQK